MSLYGTVTRLAPAGRHPPKPSHQIRSSMKLLVVSTVTCVLLSRGKFDSESKNPRAPGSRENPFWRCPGLHANCPGRLASLPLSLVLTRT